MIIPEIRFTLKDGREALIRSPRDEDIPGMLEYLYVSAGETEFIIRYPEECDKYTVEAEKALFDRDNASDHEAMLVCLVEGKVVGNSMIAWKTSIKTRHRASVAIALLKDYWNQGIGTRMFREMIRIAEENPNILQMELEFVEGNTRARALYEKMGFRIVGVRPNAIRLKDGTLLNEYAMVREIRRQDQPRPTPIRPARREDLAACADLIRRSFMTVAEEFGLTEENAPRFTAFATDEARLLRQLEEERRPMFVWEEAGRLRGYYSLSPAEDGSCELSNLAVPPEDRHAGIGGALLAHAEAEARAAGCTLMHIGIVEENRRLRGWYERNGAVHTGTKKFDFFPFTCGYMEIRL